MHLHYRKRVFLISSIFLYEIEQCNTWHKRDDHHQSKEINLPRSRSSLLISTKFFSLYDLRFWIATSSMGSTKNSTWKEVQSTDMHNNYNMQDQLFITNSRGGEGLENLINQSDLTNSLNLTQKHAFRVSVCR